MRAQSYLEGSGSSATLGRDDRGDLAAERESPATNQETLRLVDALARVEATWVEAVAVVHAVSRQLAHAHAAPVIDEVVLSSDGGVSFPETAAADSDAVVRGMGRLLPAFVRHGAGPMAGWEASESARRSPSSFGSARAFGDSLTCFPVDQGPRELAAYFHSSRRLIANPARPATAMFGASNLAARAGR